METEFRKQVKRVVWALKKPMMMTLQSLTKVIFLNI